MNTKLLYRLTWKELRSLRALWVSLLVMTLAVQLGSALIDNRHGDRVVLLFGAALWLPVVFSLACAAMAFAGEREEGTDQILCRLAAPPLALWIVKLMVIVLGTVTMFVIVFPVAIIGSGIDERIWAHNPYAILEPSGFRQADGVVGQMHRLSIFWGFCLLAWGLLFSLLLRRVLPCLMVSVLATLLTQWGVEWLLSLSPKQPAERCTVECLLHLGILPSLVPLLMSVWFVQRWDEDRWPRLIEWVVVLARRFSRLWVRVTGVEGEDISLVPESLRAEVGSSAGVVSFTTSILRQVGLCRPDEWLPAWRREVRRLLWLEWRSAWWVSLGLIVAGSLALLTLVRTANSQSDMRFALSTLPLTLAFVAFALGVWSFHGQQREQRFQFFAAHGASPTAMWLVKHVVWLSFAALAVAFLLSFTAFIAEGAIKHEEFEVGDLQNLMQAMFQKSPLGSWHEMDHPGWRYRLLYCAAHATGTRPSEFYQLHEVLGVWPMVSLLLLAMGRGLVMVWLCFAVGQLASLLIPRAVTAMLVGVLALGVAVGWWFVISIWRVPLLIGGCPVLLGLLAASWGRMSDWLEERSGWRRWLRVAATTLLPIPVAFVGIAMYRVYEVPLVELPWGAALPPSAEARQTGDDWLRLAEQLESPFKWRGAIGLPLDGNQVGTLEPPLDRRNPVEQNFVRIHEAELNHIKDAHWHGFAERDWLTDNAAALEKALRLANRPDCVMPKSWEPSHNPTREQFGRVAFLLKMSAFESLANHRLDEALQRALALYRFGQQLGRRRGRWYWSNHVQQAALHVLHEWALSPDQTAASLRMALGRSDAGEPHPVAQLVRAEGSFAVDPFEVLRAEYAEGLARHDELWRDGPTPYRWMPSPYHWVRWEKSRGERLLKVLAVEGDTNLRRGMIRDYGRDARQLNGPFDRLFQNSDPEHLAAPYNSPSRGERWQETTEVSLGWGWSEQTLGDSFFPVLAELETHRRGLWLTLALQAYRKEHGGLPDRLDELVGPFLERLPVAPVRGFEFEYRPNGYPGAVVDEKHILRAPNAPCLSVIGEPNQYNYFGLTFFMLTPSF